MDRRLQRVQSIKLSSDFFPLDIHKSMFINDMMITIPAYYVKAWGIEILDSHNKSNCKWDVKIKYTSPREEGNKTYDINSKLTLAFSKGRKKESCYRLKWNSDFAEQLAKDYPKSFVRALEFHIGDDYYKKIKYTEFDIGGFKEQLQLKIKWEDNKPVITIKEFFRVRNESQGFPNVFKELSSYLIADYLLSSEEEVLRRVNVTKWKNRTEISKEVNENNIYLLLNRENKEVYFGETKQSLSKRYPCNQKHHSFDNWDEYSVIQLPPETSNHTRLLIERVLIATGAKLFPNNIYTEPSVLKEENGLKLKNKKK